MKTIAELQKAIEETGTRGVEIHFGKSGSPNHRGQFFAVGQVVGGRKLPQVRAETLEEALTSVFAQSDEDDIFGDL